MVETKRRQGGEWERADETDMIRTEPEAEIKGYVCTAGEKQT